MGRPTIGTRYHAEAAYDFHAGNPHPEHKNFVRAGSGAFRSVYLHEPSGVCYKVDRGNSGSDMSNKSEARNARRLAKREWTHVRIPQVSLFRLKADRFVLAMELIIGSHGMDVPNAYNTEGYHEWFNPSLRTRMPYDMHGKNFFIDSEGYFVPVDMGS